MDWKNYDEARPSQAGVYEWRIPSAVIDGLIVLAAAHMRMRHAGYEDVLSPSFDDWDGYKVKVPKGVQWREPKQQWDIARNQKKLIGIEGLEHAKCIYCGKTPVLSGMRRAYDGGVMLGMEPHRLNLWHLECCAWGGTPWLSDPRELERIRRAAIETARNSACAG